jgi:hypothetical protein
MVEVNLGTNPAADLDIVAIPTTRPDPSRTIPSLDWANRLHSCGSFGTTAAAVISRSWGCGCCCWRAYERASFAQRRLLDARRLAQRYLLSHRSDLTERISENTLNGALKRMGFE